MKTILKLLIFLLLFSGCSEKSQVNVVNLRCEYKVNPVGIDIEKPRFSWNLESEQRGISQTQYQVLVASSLENLNGNIADVWDSGNVPSDKSIQIEYEGKPLESNMKYYWKVKVWDREGEIHESEPAFWTTGLMHESEWQAKWIGLDKGIGSDEPKNRFTILSARMLRKEFDIENKIKSATAFISGLGLFEMSLNGQKIGDQVLAPGLTQYNKRAFYMTFDVTENLQTGQNAIGVILGNGRFFAPRTGSEEQTATFGFPKMICRLVVQFEDGSSQTIVSDETWKQTTMGPIRKNNEYDGEFYDARMELKDWSKPGFDDKNWMNVELVEKPGEKLVAQPNEAIKIMDEITPVSVQENQPGTWIFDMGQNMVGWVELFVKGKSGDKVKLRFAETLKDDGTLFLDNIRSAEVTDTYILKGEDEEKWEPRFTYHGFRYVEMTGFPGTPKLTSIKGKVIHDALEVSGSFTCSNPLMNRIYKNAFWGIRGNYRSIPTDCPQRDERHGWLGDRSAECTGESYIFNVSNLYNKWLADINDAQLESGSIPDVAPAYWPIYTDNTTWPGTFLFASDMLYTQYGDLKTIETNYPAMQKWIAHMSTFLNKGIMPKDTYGDWCVPPEDLRLINTSDPSRLTSAEFIGTAYFYYELKLMQKFALLLGKTADAEGFSKTAEIVKNAFNQKFSISDEVIYSNNTCTANILALAFDLVPAENKEKIVDNLLQKIVSENDGHIGNGLIGGQWLMRTLTQNGHDDVAYKLATQNTYPSWGYMVEKGATTIWELWNGDTGDPGMNSGNHVMLLGDLIIWCYEDLAGIKPDPENPGFKHIIMNPSISGELTNVDASYNSIYGKIKSNWKLENGEFFWNVTIPANTTATVFIPATENTVVKEGDKKAAKSKGVKFVKWENNRAVFEIQSGSYAFHAEEVVKNVTTSYAATPLFSPSDTILTIGSILKVEITCPDTAATIHYSTDGSLVNESSPVYSAPLEIRENTMLKATAFLDACKPSNQAKVKFSFIDPAKNGVDWSFYEGKFRELPDFSRIKPVRKGIVYDLSLNKIDLPGGSFAMQFRSFLQIEKEGTYTFYINSNDGSRLFIDDKLLIDNGGEHGAREVSSTLELEAGMHSIRADYFQAGGGKVLSVSYESAEINKQFLPEYLLFKSRN
jgi:alpha-L-rhamnosidase